MRKALKILLYIVIIIVVVLLVLIGLTCYELSKIKTTKDFIPVTIEKDEIVDYRNFAFCEGKYDIFKEIPPECRAEVANYMYENNLKLQSGEYEFCKTNPTFDELVNDNFKFEKITGQSEKEDNDNLSLDIIIEKDINAPSKLFAKSSLLVIQKARLFNITANAFTILAPIIEKSKHSNIDLG